MANKTIFSKFHIRTVGVVVVLAAIVSIVNLAYATHSWGGYHWARTANPFTLKLGDNVNTAWDGYLVTASADWSINTTGGVAKVLNTSIVKGSADPRRCRATTGTVQVCNASYGNNGWLGIAQIWISGQHITQGTTKLNDSYFNTAKYNTPAWRSMVMCQEIGHTFGLNHQDEGFANTNLGTCMDYTNDPAGTAMTNGTLNNMHPNLHDYEQLATIYAHTDSTNTFLASTATNRGLSAAAQSGQFENASEWGKSIRKDSQGKTSLYERNLGKGEKLFTFVTWVK